MFTNIWIHVRANIWIQMPPFDLLKWNACNLWSFVRNARVLADRNEENNNLVLSVLFHTRWKESQISLRLFIWKCRICFIFSFELNTFGLFFLCYSRFVTVFFLIFFIFRTLYSYYSNSFKSVEIWWRIKCNQILFICFSQFWLTLKSACQ